jgi:uncharacterized protein YggL (DUF469 family)
MKEVQTSGQRAEEFHRARNKVIEGALMVRGGGLQMGEYLTLIKKNRLWRCDGSHIRNFDTWLKNDLGMARSAAYNAMGVWKRYSKLLMLNPDFQDIYFSVLVESLPYCPEKATDEEKSELLYSLKGQTVEGVRNQLRERAGKKTSDSECDHPTDELKTVQVCRRCGKWLS